MVKAGEAGTWQAAWDDHSLAVSGPDRLAELVFAGRRLSPILHVVPYVVLRGRVEWREAEWQQIADCARVAGRVVLNLEPGDAYWQGPTDPGTLTQEYLLPLRARLAEAAPTAKVELAAIPRQWVVDELGGRDALVAWAYAVDGIQWECYQSAAPDLDLCQSLERVRVWLSGTDRAANLAYFVPLIQQSMVTRYYRSPYCAGGFAVWHLGGD